MVSASLGLPPAWLDLDCAVSEVVATIVVFFFCALSLSSLVARLIRPSWLRGLGIHEIRQHHSQAAKSILRGAGLTPMCAHRFPRFSFLCSLTFPFSLSSRPSVPAYLSLRLIWADYPWSPRWAGYSIYTSTSTSWAMARRVDARWR